MSLRDEKVEQEGNGQSPLSTTFSIFKFLNINYLNNTINTIKIMIYWFWAWNPDKMVQKTSKPLKKLNYESS